jgi:rRNA-processing protein FCF1
MKYTTEDYKRFLSKEISAQIKEYESVKNTKAVTLKDNGAIFVGKFIKFDESGIAIFMVRNSNHMPRRRTYWTAVYLVNEMSNFNNWGNNSWGELRANYQREFSDAYCVWVRKADNPTFCLVGIKNIPIEFAELMLRDMPIIAFGPSDPPLQYLYNLMDIVEKELPQSAQNILHYNDNGGVWNPVRITSNADFKDIVVNDWQSSEGIMVQGPPGTGKTQRMAALAAQLIDEGKSVLVTALTNQALMEVGKKEHIKEFIKKGRVSKTSLSTDESNELPGLNSIRSNKCNASNGYLTLASFYIASSWAVECIETPFDYVIMDEASQAFLPMIAAVFLLGKKVIWIGDQNQLSPIVLMNEDIIIKYDWNSMVKGFDTICKQCEYKSYMLCDTYRLPSKAAECTGVFYEDNLKSVSSKQDTSLKLSFLKPNGTPTILNLELPVGDKRPEVALYKIFTISKEILETNAEAKMVILSKFKDTVSALQEYFLLHGDEKLYNTIQIDTVDSVQGLTVDYCIYFIPNASIRYSLAEDLFNVATSRAAYNTIIVADTHVLRENMSLNVRRYILKAQEDKFVTFEKTNENNEIFHTEVPKLPGLKIVGKIDLPERHKERVKDKENIYIIDTNVFVNCPDIIKRIGKRFKVLVPSMVLEELDKLKLKPSVDKIKLNEAARNINSAFMQHFSKMEEADTSLLPDGFDKSNPDCKILSVALKYKSQNPIMLTSDLMLQSRASALGITTISLNDFLKH